MSSLGNRIEWDLGGKGLSIHAAILIESQQGRSRSVIADYWQPVGPRVQVYLDRDDRLFLELDDDKGQQHRAGPVPPEKFRGRRIYLRAEVVKRDKRAVLTLAIDNEDVAVCEADAILEGKGTAAQTIGSEYGGMSPATFTVAEWVLAAAASQHQYDELWVYFRKRHDLGGDAR